MTASEDGSTISKEAAGQDGATLKRKRQARSIETRARILAAATHEFATYGFDGTSTRSISERADVRHNLLIYHFETKLGVWQAVMRKVFSWYEASFEQRLHGLRGVDPVETLRLLQADFIRTAAEHPELHRLMSHEAGQSGERLEWMINNTLQDRFDRWCTLIRAAQDVGAYVAGDPLHLHYLFIGAAARIFILRAEVERTTGHDPFDPAFVEKHIALCQSLFFRQPPERKQRGAARQALQAGLDGQAGRT